MTKPFVRTFPVGDRLLTVSIPDPSRHGQMHPTLSWAPDAPFLMNDRELTDYAIGRQKVLEDLCAHLGTTAKDVLARRSQ